MELNNLNMKQAKLNYALFTFKTEFQIQKAHQHK